MSTSPRRHNRLVDEHRAALDLEEAVTENRAAAALALAFTVRRALAEGANLPPAVLDALAEFVEAHGAVLDAREVEERAGDARRAAEAEGGAR